MLRFVIAVRIIAIDYVTMMGTNVSVVLAQTVGSINMEVGCSAMDRRIIGYG